MLIERNVVSLPHLVSCILDPGVTLSDWRLGPETRLDVGEGLRERATFRNLRVRVNVKESESVRPDDLRQC